MNLEKSFDDATLVALLKEGNHLAFQEIYKRNWEKLFAYTYNILRERSMTEELVQATFVSLWAKRETIFINTSLSGYLYSMVRNEVLNHIRSEKVRSTYASHHADFLKDRADNSNIEYQDFADLERSIQNSLAGLSEKEQLAFKLSRIDHLPIKEIAEQMNLSTGTVENILGKVLKHLRGKLLSGLVIVIALTG
jgi:RNA polymerase sigma-70 factor (family 1)